MTAGRAKVALSVTAAAELLPFGAQAGRAWLRERGLVRVILGRELVLVSDLEAQIRLESPAPIDRAMGLMPAPASTPKPKPKTTGKGSGVPFIDPRTE